MNPNSVPVLMPSSALFEVLDRRPIAQSAVRPDLVVVLSPELDLLPRIGEIREPVLGETLVAEAGVEAFGMRVLDGLAGPNEVQGHDAFESPGVEDLADELRPVVDANALGLAAHGDEQVQGRHHPPAGERGVDLDRQALAGEAVHHAEAAEAAAVAELVVDEVHRPSLVGSYRRVRLEPRHRGEALALPPPHQPAVLAQEPQHQLVIPPLALEHHVKPSVPEPRPLHRLLPQVRQQLRCDDAAASIAAARPRDAQ